jgi:alcohol dehydrogenase class IV
MPKESIFSVSPSPVKFGPGALEEIGKDAKNLGMRRVALFTDRWVGQLECVETAKRAIAAEGLGLVVFDECLIEPTDQSFLEAAAFASDGDFDGYISLGGGSVMDTAKAANLYATYPDEFLAYVNAPIGQAKPVPGPLKPHIACPTTSGTGSECTGIAIFDLTGSQLKTGIASPRLKPSLGVIDPTTTFSLPPLVIASTGVDVLVHALESYTAIEYNQREAATDPSLRPPAQGANPHSDVGALEALRLGGEYLVRAVKDPTDHEARIQLMWAATLAGIAFGNAGVHIPHAMSYAVASLKKRYTPNDYPAGKPMVPHGISVIVNAPAAIRFTGPACPERHLMATRALGADTSTATHADAGELLAQTITQLMRDTGIPNGVGALGYERSDIPDLAERTFAQQRLLNNSPCPVSQQDLKTIFESAFSYW